MRMHCDCSWHTVFMHLLAKSSCLSEVLTFLLPGCHKMEIKLVWWAISEPCDGLSGLLSYHKRFYVADNVDIPALILRNYFLKGTFYSLALQLNSPVLCHDNTMTWNNFLHYLSLWEEQSFDVLIVGNVISFWTSSRVVSDLRCHDAPVMSLFRQKFILLTV